MEETVAEQPKKDVPPVDSLFEERAVQKDNEDFEKARTKLFYSAVCLALFLLAVLYFLSPGSRVKTVSVTGNDYLSRSYIRSLSSLKPGKLFYLQVPSAIEAEIEEDPVIEEANVKLLHDNIIEISVKEKQPVGYRYDEEVPTLLFSDGSECDLTSDYMPILSRIPYISGFLEENQTHLLTTAFQSVEKDIIEDMAEVIQYPLSYDEEAIEIRMRDGGIFFTNYFTMKLVNEYPTIAPLITNKNQCIYADNGTTVAAARACPWDEVPVEYEYWTDEDGNYIYNKWGDKAVKHYYQSNEGGYYLDENGDRIIIPIDAYGADQKDPDFLNHYFLGWYKKGYLDIPEEGEEGETEEGTDESEDGGEDDGSTASDNPE
ncbi:MAG: FtsQ-type POTRA domain-containing protein [Solobacterium sp.]|nr:FtsQ-type POTRA domain-containing protein [Solobacterium sp.]